MTHKQQPRNSSLQTHENMLNTSLGNARRRQPSGSIELKDRIGYNDALSKQKKTEFPSKFAYMAQKAIMEKYASKQDRQDMSYLETSPDMQHSALFDSRHDSPRDNLNRSFDVKPKKLSSSKKGSRLPTENTFIENRADTIEFIKKKSFTREKQDSLNMSKQCFQTYDSYLSSNKIGINTTKLANRTVMKRSEEVKLQEKTVKEKPKRASSAIKQQAKATDQSFYDTRASSKKKPSPARQRPPIDEKTRKEIHILMKDESLLKTRKKEKLNKTRSFIVDSVNMSREKSFANLESETSPQATTKDTKDNRKVKDIDTAFDLEDFKAKKFTGLNVDMGMYYDLLVDRSRTNAKLLKELKDNYFKVMTELSKSNGIAKQYRRMKSNYDEEQDKAKKEKELLETQLQMLKRENDRLKNLSTKHGKTEKKQVNKSVEKVAKRDPVFKEVKESITEEQRLADLLIQSEQMISFLKEKEVKYMSLFKALEAEGIDLNKIYAKHTKTNSTFTEEGEIRMKTLPDMTTETQEDYINRQIKNNVHNRSFHHQHSFESSQSYMTEDFSSQCPEQSQFGGEQDHSRGKSLEKNSLDLKQKFKLDLAAIQKKVIKQYHDEFMEKWPEFTSSWKRAIERDKTYTK